MNIESARKLVNKEVVIRMKTKGKSIGFIGCLFAGKVIEVNSRSYGDFILLLIDIDFDECRHIEIDINQVEWYRGVK